MKTVRIVTSSLGTLELVSPPYNLSVPRLEDNVRRASDILHAALALSCCSWERRPLPP